jgi:hypothetical protein
VGDVVTRGVKLGYQVIEEYIRQGQRTAARIRGASQPESSKPGGREEMLETMLRFYKDMADLWIDGVGGIVRSPAFTSWFNGAVQRNGASAPPPQEAGSGDGEGTKGTLVVEVLSKRRAQVTLNLRPHPGRNVPLVHALHASDPAVPPLTGISFRRDPKSAVPVLQLKISNKQPPGMYTGVVVDRETNEPQGTLCVRVLA